MDKILFVNPFAFPEDDGNGNWLNMGNLKQKPFGWTKKLLRVLQLDWSKTCNTSAILTYCNVNNYRIFNSRT